MNLIFIACIETGKWNWIKGRVWSNIKEYRISKWSSTSCFTVWQYWGLKLNGKCMYLLKLQRHGWNSIVSPRHKYSVKKSILWKGKKILQDHLAMTYTFNYNIYFILDSPSYTSEINGMCEIGKKPP